MPSGGSMGAAQSTEKLVTLKSGRTRVFRSKQERRQIVEETLKPGASVALVARTHGVNVDQLFAWRRMYRDAPAAHSNHWSMRFGDMSRKDTGVFRIFAVEKLLLSSIQHAIANSKHFLNRQSSIPSASGSIKKVRYWR